VTTILILVGIATVVIWLIVRKELRDERERFERRREEWRAGGCVGPEPGKYMGPERSWFGDFFFGGGGGY
jgi:hypothetical protein